MKLFGLSPLLVIVGFFLIVAALLGYISRSSLHGRIQEAEEQQEFGSYLSRAPSRGPGDPPVLAYWISGTHGDGRRIARLLRAVYHPRNRYLLHLDAGSTAYERYRLARDVQSERVFRAFANVDVMGKGYGVDEMGASAVGVTIHAAAVLLKLGGGWDWFVTLGASDYPLVTQDDLLHVFASLTRDVNFIGHTSNLGPEKIENFDRIVVDPSLHLGDDTRFFYGSGSREMPDAFKIFTGSQWVILSRPFMEHCVFGWDNLPRKLLMYSANIANTLEFYFHTILCNSPEFISTAVNNDLSYYIINDGPINASLNYKGMIQSRAAFARGFGDDDPLLHLVDVHVLRRSPNRVSRGKWCTGQLWNQSRRGLEEEDPCASWGDINVVEPGPTGAKLGRRVSELVSDMKWDASQCS